MGQILRRRPIQAGIVLFIVLGILAASAIAWAARMAPNPHPLANATPDQIGQLAVHEAEQSFETVQGTPEVLLTRWIKPEDMEKLGLGAFQPGSIETPPYVLVILKGDFAGGRFPGLTSGRLTPPIHYVGYVYDLWAGAPTITLTSATGGVFRTALNDPTLPDEGPFTGRWGGPALAAPGETPPPSTFQKYHYGDMAPTVVPATVSGGINR